MLETIWSDTMRHFQFEDNKLEFERIKLAYNENHRHYHNLNHISSLFELIKSYNQPKTNYALNLAIFYHDIEYKILGKNNELHSAKQAFEFLSNQKADQKLKTKVYDLILATLHNEQPKNIDEAILMDIDIAILGSNSLQYEEYCSKIRKEYQLIPWIIYKKKRCSIMKMFLNKENIFHTPYFRNKFEATARRNIENEIKSLSS